MKKTLVLLLVLSIVLSFSACRKPNDHPTTLTTPAISSNTVTPTTQKPPTEPPVTTIPPTTQAPTTEPTVTTVPPTTQSPTTEPPATTVPPATQAPTTEPLVTTVLPTTQAPTTEPTEPSTTDSTSPVFDFRAIVNTYSGIWYLDGYADVYIYIWESATDSNLQIDVVNFALPPAKSPISAYSIYPYKQFMDMPNGDYWCNGFELINDPTLWNITLNKYKLEFAKDQISLGGRTFVRRVGSIDQYSDTCYRQAIGLWYLENHPTSTLDIRLERDYGLPCGHYFTIISSYFDFYSLEPSGSEIVQGWAGRQNNWDQYGISIEENTLIIRNENGTKYFYREPTYPTQPPSTEPTATEQPVTVPSQTEPIETEPTVTVPPATDPPQTEPETTPPATTVPHSDVLIINDTQTISKQTIDTDVYITSTGVATFDNVTVNGNVYCYGQLIVNDGSANNLYAYYWDMGFMTSSCDAWDGAHGLVKGAFSSCGEVVIKDHALDQAFSKWGRQ